MKYIFDSQQSLFRNVECEKNKKLSSTFFILIIPVIIFIFSAFSTELLGRLIDLMLLTRGLNPFMYPPTALLINTGTAIILIFLVVRLKEQRSIKTLGLLLNHQAIKHYLRGLVIGIVMFGISVGMIVISTKGQITFEGVRLKAATPFVLMITAWMVQGASEEILLRGYMLPALAVRRGAKFAVIISSVYFAALHLLNNGITFLSFMNIVLVGIFTTLYALYEDSIWGVCGWHSAWNFAQGNLFGCYVSGMQLGGGSVFLTRFSKGSKLITGGTFGPEASLVVTIVFIAAIGLSGALLKKTSNKVK